MAPNNKPKKPTMLQRQRQLRAQQQQVRRASSNQLPPSGSSNANSRQARAQRANTTRAQAANNQRVINRGIEGFIRRGNAQDKLDKAAQGTRGSGTRTAGAGGGLARRPSSAVTPANRSQGGAAASTRVQPVRVRDVTNKPQMTGSKSPARLPGGTGGADTVRGSGVRTGQPGPNRAALPPGRLGELMRDATTGRRGPIGASSGRGMAAEGALAIAGSAAINRLGQTVGNALRKQRTERTVGMSSKGGRYVPGDQQRPTPSNTTKPAAKTKTPTSTASNTTPTSSGGRRVPSSGTQSPARRSSAVTKPAAIMPKSSGPSTPSPSSESYRDGGKGLYQGSKAYRDKVGGSGNPLLNKLRQDLGRDAATGNKVSSPSPQVDYKPQSQVDGSKLDSNKATNRPFDTNAKVEDKVANSLKKWQQEEDKKKKNQSTVVGG